MTHTVFDDLEIRPMGAGSSAVERAAHNGQAAGSIPARRTKHRSAAAQMAHDANTAFVRGKVAPKRKAHVGLAWHCASVTLVKPHRRSHRVYIWLAVSVPAILMGAVLIAGAFAKAVRWAVL